MYLTIVQIVLLSLLGHAYAAASTCSQLPIAVFTPLGKVPAAQAYCTAKYPLVRCTTTQTSTSTQTVLNTVATATVFTATVTVPTTVATATTTVTSATLTATLTTDTTTVTVFTATTVVTVFTSTQTNCQNIGRRQVAQTIDPDTLPPIRVRPASTNAVLRRGRFDRRAPAAAPAPVPATTTPANALLSSLQAKATSLVKAVCTCIETPLPCATAQASTTVLYTTPVTATISTAATETTPATATATLYTDTTVTVSVQGTTTASLESTSTLLAVTTITAQCLRCSTAQFCLSNALFQVYCGSFATGYGAYQAATTTVASVDACRTVCVNRAACNLFNFNGPTGVCTLYDSVPGSNTVNSSPDPLQAFGYYVGAC